MPRTNLDVTTHVSVQVRDCGEQLAVGVLAAPHAVIVPGWFPSLHDPEVDIEVKIFARRPSHLAKIERHDAWCRKALVLDPRIDDSIATVITLAQSSHHPVTLLPFSPDQLGAVLAEHGGDLWTAFEALEVVPAGTREGPGPSELARAAEIERFQRRAGISKHVIPSPADLGNVFCIFICCPWVPVTP
jgi:hypothetical protein